MATVTYIREQKQSVSAMKAVMRYCMKEEKIWDEHSQTHLISGINCDSGNTITEFLATKTAHGKLDGINFYQYVQSFSPREKLTPAQAHEIAMEFAEKAWPGHEVQVTTHCDAAHIHSHFIINSVAYETGQKLRQNPTTLKQLRKLSDEICLAHNLSVLKPYEKGGRKLTAREYRAAKKGQSWKFKLMYQITKAMEKSSSQKDFLLLMKRAGYEVHCTEERKYITFTCPNGMKCRCSKLHDPKFLKENIGHELRLREQFLREYVSGGTDEGQRRGAGHQRVGAVPAGGLRHTGGMAAGGESITGTGGAIPTHPLPNDPDPRHPAGAGADADSTGANPPGGEAGDPALHPNHTGTGWERERQAFIRMVEGTVGKSQGHERDRRQAGKEGYEADDRRSVRFGSGLGAGMLGLASAGSLIETDPEDPEERRRRIEAEQAGSNLGTVLGLALVAAMAMTEEEEIEEQEELNERYAEEENDWHQTMM